MNHDEVVLAPALYLVATPLGNARDITLRALDILAGADLLAAEDTRSLKKLMEIHGVPLKSRRVIAYHDHSKARVREQIIGAIKSGQSVAYASEAGTPMIADPGYHLVTEAQDAGVQVTAAPGASAVVTALTLGGLPTDMFSFLGFLPNAQTARRKALEGVAGIGGTLVFYESPRRVAAMLADAAGVLGEEREVRVCREMTKRFEEVKRGSLGELASELEGTTLKGEVVVLIGKGAARVPEIDEIKARLGELLQDMSLRDAASYLAEDTGLKRRDLYQIGLELQNAER